MIECSTLSHDWVLELSGEAQRRSLSYIDCPVTGLPDMAAAGELTLLVGAATEDAARAQPVLDAFSKQTIHFGPVGAGTVYKLMINLQGAIQIASIAEGMAIAERAGLNLATVADAIASGQAASPQVGAQCASYRRGRSRSKHSVHAAASLERHRLCVASRSQAQHRYTVRCCGQRSVCKVVRAGLCR